MNATFQHNLVHLHLTKEMAKRLKEVLGCLSVSGEHGLKVGHPPGSIYPPYKEEYTFEALNEVITGVYDAIGAVLLTEAFNKKPSYVP